MNNPFRIFTSPLFGNVRAAYIDGVAWFVGKDVCRALGYKDHRYALDKHVDIRDKSRCGIHTPGGKQAAIIINESGLYALVLASRLPFAQEFKHWVTAEVVPSIRKTGSYSLVEPPAQVQHVIEQAALLEPLALADKLLEVARLMTPSPERDKVLIRAANLLNGEKIF